MHLNCFIKAITLSRIGKAKRAAFFFQLNLPSSYVAVWQAVSDRNTRTLTEEFRGSLVGTCVNDGFMHIPSDRHTRLKSPVLFAERPTSTPTPPKSEWVKRKKKRMALCDCARWILVCHTAVLQCWERRRLQALLCVFIAGSIHSGSFVYPLDFHHHGDAVLLDPAGALRSFLSFSKKLHHWKWGIKHECITEI